MNNKAFMNKLNDFMDKWGADPENFDVEKHVEEDKDFWQSPIPDGCWNTIAERFAKFYAKSANQPEWAENPTEALACQDKTSEDFEKEYSEYDSLNILMLFEYVFDLPKGCMAAKLK